MINVWAWLYRRPMHQLFLAFAPLLYAAYALLTPPFQTPDEQQHLFRAWQLSEFHLIGERRGNQAGGVLPAALGRAALPELGTLEPHVTRKVVVRPLGNLFYHGTPVQTGEPGKFFDFVGSVIYSPAGYIPQLLAIWLGRPLGLSVEHILLLGRLFNSALAILLIYFAIRLAPIGRLPLVWVGLLPMTASVSASFGQDGLVIGGSCLLTTLGLRAVLDGRWKRSELLLTAGLTVLLTLSKIFYLPLSLIAAQPFAEGKTWRRLAVPAIICAVCAVLTSVWLHAVSPVMVSPAADIPPASARLMLWLHHPTALLMLLEHTYIGKGYYIVDTLFKFGWLNVGPDRHAEFVGIAAFFLALIAGDPEAGLEDWKTRLGLLLLAMSALLLVSVALYLYSRPAGDQWVEGFQGRYLIPIAPALMTALLPQRPRSGIYTGLVVMLLLAANLFALRSIALAFYSF